MDTNISVSKGHSTAILFCFLKDVLKSFSVVLGVIMSVFNFPRKSCKLLKPEPTTTGGSLCVLCGIAFSERAKGFSPKYRCCQCVNMVINQAAVTV